MKRSVGLWIWPLPTLTIHELFDLCLNGQQMGLKSWTYGVCKFSAVMYTAVETTIKSIITWIILLLFSLLSHSTLNTWYSQARLLPPPRRPPHPHPPRHPSRQTHHRPPRWSPFGACRSDALAQSPSLGGRWPPGPLLTPAEGRWWWWEWQEWYAVVNVLLSSATSNTTCVFILKSAKI